MGPVRLASIQRDRSVGEPRMAAHLVQSGAAPSNHVACLLDGTEVLDLYPWNDIRARPPDYDLGIA